MQDSVATDGLDVELPQDVIDAIRAEVVPLIAESCRKALDAYDIDPEFNDNWIFGSYGWRNSFIRMSKVLDRDRWKIESSENDLRLIPRWTERVFEFRVHRCKETTWLPTGAKRAKRIAIDQYFLDPSIATQCLSSYQLVIGYVSDEVNGLREVRVIQLFRSSHKELLAKEVAVLYEAERMDVASTLPKPEPERVETPGIKKSPTVGQRAPARDEEKKMIGQNE